MPHADSFPDTYRTQLSQAAAAPDLLLHMHQVAAGMSCMLRRVAVAESGSVCLALQHMRL